MIDTSRWDARQVKSWSWSRIQAAECPFRWGLLYLEKRKEAVGEAAQVGNIAHAVTAEYRRKWLEIGADTLYSNHLEKVARAAAKKEGIPEEIASKGHEIALKAINHMGLLPRDKPKKWWVEERWGFTEGWHVCEWVGPAVHWRGIGDFVWIDAQGALHVEDDKSGWSTADRMQTLIYAHLACRVAGIEPAEIYCRHNYLAKLESVEEITSWDEIRDYVPEWIEAQIRRIQAIDDWSPSPGNQCSWCGFKPECPAIQETGTDLDVATGNSGGSWLREIVQTGIATQANAQAALRFKILATELLGQLDGRLEEYVRQHGPVAAAGKVAEIREQAPEWSMDAEPCVLALLERGVPRETIWQNLSTSKTTVERILKDHIRIEGTKEEREEAKYRRSTTLAEILALGTSEPRDPKFGVWKDKLG